MTFKVFSNLSNPIILWFHDLQFSVHVLKHLRDHGYYSQEHRLTRMFSSDVRGQLWLPWAPPGLMTLLRIRKLKILWEWVADIQHSVPVLHLELPSFKQHWLEYQQHVSFSKPLGQAETTERHFFFFFNYIKTLVTFKQALLYMEMYWGSGHSLVLQWVSNAGEKSY